MSDMMLDKGLRSVGLDGDMYGDATDSLVDLEHENTNYLLGGQPMAIYQIGISEEQLHGLLEAVLEGRATAQLRAAY